MCEFFDSWPEQKRGKIEQYHPHFGETAYNTLNIVHLFEKHWWKRKNGHRYGNNNFLHFPSTRRSSIDNHGAITARNAYYQSSIDVQTSRVNRIYTYIYIYLLMRNRFTNGMIIITWYDGATTSGKRGRGTRGGGNRGRISWDWWNRWSS